MTLHYHGTPISPIEALYELAGRCFCVSFAAPQDVVRCHSIGQSIMLDNGAFSLWKTGKATSWPEYYVWSDKWLEYQNTWAVIPDVIDGSEEQQADLIAQWPHGQKGAPVWHMNEGLGRLLSLIERWGRVCIGSTKAYATVLSDAWRRRMDEVWDAIVRLFHRIPIVHMLRGMQCCGMRWPFASVDSTDIGRNHNRPQNTPRSMADRWDGVQCPATWQVSSRQKELFECQS